MAERLTLKEVQQPFVGGFPTTVGGFDFRIAYVGMRLSYLMSRMGVQCGLDPLRSSSRISRFEGRPVRIPHQMQRPGKKPLSFWALPILISPTSTSVPVKIASIVGARQDRRGRAHYRSQPSAAFAG
jgi:hypothetical protein